jgi:hypothetical protein
MLSRARAAATAGLFLANAAASLALAVAPAAATPADTFQQLDVRVQLNTCSGETVVLVGTAHYAIKPNPDGTSTWHFQLHSEGVGDQGNPYLLNVIRESVFSVGGGTEEKVDSHEVLVSMGSAPNQVGVFHFDLATGEFEFVLDCTG